MKKFDLETKGREVCEYCGTTNNKYLLDDVYMATAHGSRVITSHNSTNYLTLSFCPMCGRKLNNNK